ncbi:MAG: DUF1874 domain-containing protein, partial [Deltaproteobacteria bacterium]
MTLLNASILTEYGTYRFEPLTQAQARALIDAYRKGGGRIESAIGHATTAQLLSELLGVEVPENRIEYHQEVGEEAIVFRLKHRPPPGKILDVEEM